MGVQGHRPGFGEAPVTAKGALGTILTEAAARWLYGLVPFRDVGSTAAEQVMKAVM